MLKKVLIGGAVVVGGYLAYKWWKGKQKTGTVSTANAVDSWTAKQMEDAAYIAQKFNPGYASGLEGVPVRVIY